jgi:Ser-tRNA(Ala) deacylase AlaX
MERTHHAYHHDGVASTLVVKVLGVKRMNDLTEEDKSLNKGGKEDDSIVIVDSTIFHPQGGGQPSDVGVMKSESGTIFKVHMVRTSSEWQGVVLHFGRYEDTSSSFEAGDSATQTIDMAVRNLHSRYHTAGHVLGAAVRHLVQDQVENFDETKASHFPDSASCEFQGSIDGKWKEPIQKRLDEYIEKDMPVEIDWWDEEDFKKQGLERLIPDRKVMGMTETEKFRVVRIVGAEVYPCGGTHVPSTKQCGKTMVKKISRSKGTSRVGYTLP